MIKLTIPGQKFQDLEVYDHGQIFKNKVRFYAFIFYSNY